MTAGLQLLITDFAHSGGVEALLAVWTPEERRHAKGQLRQIKDQLERLDAQLPSDKGAADPDPEGR